MKKWTLNSWRNYPVKHIPKYEDEKELTMVLKKVSSFPPLVFAGETRALKKSIFSHGMFLLLAICLYSFIGLIPPARTKENLFFSLLLIFTLNNLINFLIKKFSLLW